MSKLFATADERNTAVLVLAGALAIADTIHSGVATGDLADARAQRALTMARTLITHAENSPEAQQLP